MGLAGGVNLYAYAGNNPVAFSDPYGLSECSLQKWKECRVFSLTGGVGPRGIGAKASLGSFGSLEASTLGAGAMGKATLSMGGWSRSSSVDATLLTIKGSVIGKATGEFSASCSGDTGLACTGRASAQVNGIGGGGSCTASTGAAPTCSPTMNLSEASGSSGDGLGATGTLGLVSAGVNVHPIEAAIGLAGTIVEFVDNSSKYAQGARAGQRVPLVGGTPSE